MTLIKKIKTRVPNVRKDEPKHIVCEIDYDHKTLYADYTDFHDQSKPDKIPVYIANDVSDMVLYTHLTRDELSDLGVY